MRISLLCRAVFATVALALSVAQAQTYTSTTTLAVSPSSVARGANATATATVTSSNGNSAAAGTVTFYLGTTALATETLAHGMASVTGNSGDVAVGVYPVKAVYNGNAQTSGSTSAVVNFFVKNTTATAFQIAPVVVAVGAEATLTVTVSGAGATPTGTVSFYTGSLYLARATLANGMATLQVSSKGASPGTYSLSAIYSGDASNVPSTGTTRVSLEQTTAAFSIVQAGAALATGATTQFSITPAPSGGVQWYVNGVAGGSAATGTMNASGQYTAPSAAAPLSVLVSATEASAPKLFCAAVPVYVVVRGSVGTSNNPQVAAYSINAPPSGQMSVEFGLTTAYGRATWQQPTGGGTMKMLVAGMNAPATYHMRADINFGSGIVFHDADQTFITAQAVPPIIPTVTQTAGLTPQPGLEMVNPITDMLYAYDLQGNYIWGMGPPTGSTGSAGALALHQAVAERAPADAIVPGKRLSRGRHCNSRGHDVRRL